MPDLIRHPEFSEVTGFRPSPECRVKEILTFYLIVKFLIWSDWTFFWLAAVLIWNCISKVSFPIRLDARGQGCRSCGISKRVSGVFRRDPIPARWDQATGYPRFGAPQFAQNWWYGDHYQRRSGRRLWRHQCHEDRSSGSGGVDRNCTNTLTKTDIICSRAFGFRDYLAMGWRLKAESRAELCPWSSRGIKPFSAR